MTGSTFLRISIGVVICLAAITYEARELRQLAPSLEDFRQTNNISGIYSYKWYGRNVVTRINGKVFFCGINYEGGHGSCFVPLEDVPNNSRIKVVAASIKTRGGNALYASSIAFDGREIYRKPPDKSLHRWWIDSWLEVTGLPMLLMAIYIAFLNVFFRSRR